MKHALEVFSSDCDINVIEYNGKPSSITAMSFFRKQVNVLKPVIKRCVKTHQE